MKQAKVLEPLLGALAGGVVSLIGAAILFLVAFGGYRQQIKENTAFRNSAAERAGSEIEQIRDAGQAERRALREIPVGTTPVGTVMAYAGDWPSENERIQWEARTGWMLCNGRSLPRTKYEDLYSAITTSHGSDSNGTFRIPDHQGVFLRGVGGGPSRNPDAGERVALNSGGHRGDRVGSFEAHAFAPHSHKYYSRSREDGKDSDYVSLFVGSKGEEYAKPTSIEAGSKQAHETRPTNVAVHWIVRYRNELMDTPSEQ